MYVLSISSLSEVKMVLPLGLIQYFPLKVILINYRSRLTKHKPSPALFIPSPVGLFFAQATVHFLSARVFFKSTVAADRY